MKTKLSSIPIVLMTLVFALSPQTRAVVPPPDGGYPGGNTAEGQNALFGLTTGGFNTAIGFSTLRALSTNSFNTAIGAGALFANTADSNTAIGVGALFSNTTGTENLAEGPFAMFLNTQGSFNTAVGFQALFSNTTGDNNTAVGVGALDVNTAGTQNSALGVAALQSNVDGIDNTAVGNQALGANTSGNENTSVGFLALSNNTSGNNNIAIGPNAGFAITTASNVICIGRNLAGENVSNSCYIDNIFNATSSSGSAVFVNANGKLGTSTSSQRFKEGIKPMDKGSEKLFALKPVSFRYKKAIDPAGTSQLGLVAEDVEKVNPDLVVRDKEGKPYSVRYDQVNAMLLNEFLKEHHKVQEQEATIADLKKAVETLIAHSKEQDLQIQKVRDEVLTSRPEIRLAVSGQ